jgi:hypothetical protein
VTNALLADFAALKISDPDLDRMAVALVSHRHYPCLNLQKSDKATPNNSVTTKASYKTQFVNGFPQLIKDPEAGEMLPRSVSTLCPN